jgi:hypothetical protein
MTAPSNDRAEALDQLAVACRRLAPDAESPSVRDRLIEMAGDYEARARRLHDSRAGLRP